jgi:hypothetical protein
MKINENITEKALAAMAERVHQNVRIFTELEERRELNINKYRSDVGNGKSGSE